MSFTKPRALHLYAIKTSLLAAILASAVGCNGKSERDRPGQVVARVNGKEITVYQVNYQLQRTGIPVTAGDSAAETQRRNAVISDLITQRLVVEKALEDKIDRDPTVLQALESARDAVLAQAYLEKVIASRTTQPNEEQVRQYYIAHPELFSGRRIYRGEQIVLDKSISKAEITDRIAHAKSLDEVVNWLNSKNSGHVRATAFEEPAERLPLEVLPELSKMTTGATSAIESPTNLFLVHLTAAIDQPVTQEQAKAAITSFLINQEHKDILDKEIELLKSRAKIEVVDGGQPHKDAEQAESALSAGKTTVPATPPDDHSAINKGVSGLN